MIGPYDSSGFPVGCKSACDANLDGDQGEFVRECFDSSILTLYPQPTRPTAVLASTTLRRHAHRPASLIILTLVRQLRGYLAVRY